jgi:hypothetical protein
MDLVSVKRNNLVCDCYCLLRCTARVVWWVGTKVLGEAAARLQHFCCDDGGSRIFRNIYLPNNTAPHPRSQTAWSRVLYDKLVAPKLDKKFPLFYGTRKFITLFTTAHHLSLYWARSIQSTPSHPISLRFVQYYPPIYAAVFQAVSFPTIPPSELRMYIYTSYVLPAVPIL